MDYGLWIASEVVPRTHGNPGEEVGVNPKILVRVTAPTVVIGVLLFAACLVSVGYISYLQNNLTDILSRNVASLQAAQELEIRVRQLRHHNLLYLMAPKTTDLDTIRTDQSTAARSRRPGGFPGDPRPRSATADRLHHRPRHH